MPVTKVQQVSGCGLYKGEGFIPNYQPADHITALTAVNGRVIIVLDRDRIWSKTMGKQPRWKPLKIWPISGICNEQSPELQIQSQL